LITCDECRSASDFVPFSFAKRRILRAWAFQGELGLGILEEIVVDVVI
jgi:hypothetical protein